MIIVLLVCLLYFQLAALSGSQADAVAEQMIPTEAFGNTYVLGTDFNAHNLVHTFKIVLLKAGDRCTVNGTSYTATRNRDVLELSGYANNTMEIVGTNKLFVSDVMGGKSAGPDISMLLPTPVDRWNTSYTVYAPYTDRSESTGQVIVSLLMPATMQPSWIHISGGTVSCCLFPYTRKAKDRK